MISRTVSSFALGAVGLAVVVAVWHMAAVGYFLRPNGEPGSVPPPLIVFAEAAQKLSEPLYWNAIGQTLVSALAGYAISLAIAVVFGVLVMFVPPLEQLFVQLGVVAACIPVTAIAPIIVLLTPIGSRGASIAVAVFSVILPMILGVLVGLRATSPAQLDLVHAHGGGTLTAIRRVRIFAALPAFIAALKIGVPTAFLGAILGEFFLVGVDSGAGRLLMRMQNDSDYVGLWAVAVILSLVSAVGFLLVTIFARVLAPWTAHVKGVGA